MTTAGTDHHLPATGPLVISGDGAVRTLVLHRPAARNAFDGALKTALMEALRSAAADDSVRVVVITGAGGAFCAGQDLHEHLAGVRAGDEAVASTVTDFYNPLIRLVTGMPKPVVAAIDGVAAGAGAALAFACDLRLASGRASFAMAFAGAGLSTDSGASFTLPRLIGAGRALALMLTGRRVPADEALRIGMVDEVVETAAFAGRVAEVSAALAAGPSTALAAIKASVRFAQAHSLDEALDFENAAQVTCFASADHREALEAFAAKRPPVFHAGDDGH